MRPTDVNALRTHLSRALDVVPIHSDSVTAPERQARYLEPELEALIDRVSAFEGTLTLIVGSGASMEAGLPSWPSLIRTMLAEVAVEVVEESLRARWVEAIEQEGPLAAAAVVKALRPDTDQFRDLLRRSLYLGRPIGSYVPQALTQQIAWMKRELGDGVRIATGNYDGLIEQALRDEGLDVHSYVTGRTEPAGSAAVYHLHGRLMPAYPATGRLILSEDDYARVQHPGAWQERFMRDALENSLCIFVGLSMTDPNLIRWLYRYSETQPDPSRHVALFVRQGSGAASAALRRSLEHATRERWARCGVESVWADFFGESAQVLHELALRRTRPEIPRFHDRAEERRGAAHFFLAPIEEGEFQSRQDTWSGLLVRLLDGVRQVAEIAAGVDLSNETLGLGLWVVNHAEGTVACWVTADRRLNSTNAFIDNPLEYDSRWVAVQAITRGVVVQDDPNVFASRWRLVRGIPIVVSGDRGEGRGAIDCRCHDADLDDAPRGVCALPSTTRTARGARPHAGRACFSSVSPMRHSIRSS